MFTFLVLVCCSLTVQQATPCTCQGQQRHIGKKQHCKGSHACLTISCNQSYVLCRELVSEPRGWSALHRLQHRRHIAPVRAIRIPCRQNITFRNSLHALSPAVEHLGLLTTLLCCGGNLSLHAAAGLLFIHFTTGDTLHLSGTTEIQWDKSSTARNSLYALSPAVEHLGLLTTTLCFAGNLSLNPEAGLLFIDFSTGDTLHLSGTTEIHWDDTALPGAQRTIHFQTEAWVHVTGALPIHQRGSVHSSPYNPSPPSSLHQVRLKGSLQLSWRLQCLVNERWQCLVNDCLKHVLLFLLQLAG